MTVNSEETTRALVGGSEPPDGTRLAVDCGDNEWKVIWRDDAAADHWYDGDAQGQHWLNSDDDDPMGLHQHLKYARAVYRLGEPIGAAA